ncbi:MAG TPA: ABC transporter permease, partial [Gammaproteobacteria bacterium]|nr:ABC transporter permease [Gammaproteobacteria bacterium]
MDPDKPRRPRHRVRFGWPFLANIGQDVRYTVRTLSRNPGFTLLAVMILALGIGANTAVFSLLNAVVLRPLPFEAPDRLVVLWDDFSSLGAPARTQPAAADYVDWKSRARSFEGLALMEKRTYNLTGGGEPEKLAGIRTTENLFSLLSLQPLLGRTFQPDDEGPDASPVAVVSQDLWIRRFGGDPSLIGQSIVLDGLKRTVIGVVPDDFQFPDKDAAVWVPASFTPAELAVRNTYSMYVVGRLKTGISLGQAQAEMRTLAKVLEQERPTGANQSVTVAPLHEELSHSIRPALFILLGAVGMVLLITCATVANLLLARGASRQKELALRQALGAGQGRMMRQLLTESAVLGALGLIAGVALSTVSFGYLARLVPGTLPQGTHLGLDWRVLGLTAGVTLLTILLFGTGPALAATRFGFAEALKKGGVGRSAGTASARLRSALVVSEITLTVVLLVGAGLLLRSYAAVLAVDPGFRPEHLLLAETELSPSKYGNPTERVSFAQRVLERVDALPGVASAGYVNFPPLMSKSTRALVAIEGQPPPGPKDIVSHLANNRIVSTGYLQTLAVPLVAGRQFDERDSAEAAPTVIVNQAMARRYWTDKDPLGKRFRVFQENGTFGPLLTVVGDVRESGLATPVEPAFYVPLGQTNVTARSATLWPKYLVVRTSGNPMGLAQVVRKAVWNVDANQPVSSVRPMSDVFDQVLSDRNTQLTLVGGLAVLA